jgi:hypothetical protein
MVKKITTKIEFRGKVELKNRKNNAEFKAFLTEEERKDLFAFIQVLNTNDIIDFVYYDN